MDCNKKTSLVISLAGSNIPHGITSLCHPSKSRRKEQALMHLFFP